MASARKNIFQDFTFDSVGLLLHILHGRQVKIVESHNVNLLHIVG
jgi:hypothetical protein